MAGYVPGTDSFVAKVAADGQVLWQKSFAVTGNDRLFKIRAVPSGGYVAVGYRQDDGGGGAVRLLRLAENGDLTWEKLYTRPNLIDDIMGLHALPNGGVAVSFRTANAVGPPNWVFHLLTTDAAGAAVLQSQLDFGLGPQLGVRDLVALGSGDFVLAGRVPNCYLCTGQLGSLIRIDSAGAVVWSKRFEYTGGGVSSVDAVAALADGNLALAGQVTGASVAEAWVAKVNAATGALVWSKRYPHAGGVATSVLEAANGELLVGGNSYHSSVSTSYAWMMRVSGAGALLAAHEYPLEGSDVLPEVWPVAAGGYIMNGLGGLQVRLIRMLADGSAGDCKVSSFTFSAAEDANVTVTDLAAGDAKLPVSPGVGATSASAASFSFTSSCP